jgi:hypothetical protein
MLAALQGSVSERKLRLFAAGCCRRIEHLFRDERSRRAVETAERQADGLASEGDLRAAREGARAAVRQLRHGRGAPLAALGARQAAASALTQPMRAPRWAALAAAQAETAAARGQARARLVGAWGKGLALVPAELAPATWQAMSLPAWWAVRADEAEDREFLRAREAVQRQEQCRLLREILGNPFRPPTVDRTWLSWGGGAAARVARAVYEESAFDQLPILADALEEAGCGDAELLTHLRSEGPHVRGCWALDAVLGLD